MSHMTLCYSMPFQTLFHILQWYWYQSCVKATSYDSR